MTVHSFAYVVGNVDPFADDFEDRFFNAGCDDATLAVMHGAVVVCFDREADQYKDAVLSAYDNIIAAGATLERFEPDYLVSASEIAKRAGLSRSAVSLFEKGERGEGYPKPCARITTASPLWDWVEVSRWLVERGTIGEEEFRSALISRIINFDVQRGRKFGHTRKLVVKAATATMAVQSGRSV